MLKLTLMLKLQELREEAELNFSPRLTPEVHALRWFEKWETFFPYLSQIMSPLSLWWLLPPPSGVNHQLGILWISDVIRTSWINSLLLQWIQRMFLISQHHSLTCNLSKWTHLWRLDVEPLKKKLSLTVRFLFRHIILSSHDPQEQSGCWYTVGLERHSADASYSFLHWKGWAVISGSATRLWLQLYQSNKLQLRFSQLSCAH